MSQLSDLQFKLNSVDSQNPAVNDEVDAVHQYTELVKAGQLSPADYKELLLDIQRTLDVNKQAIEQDQLNTINMCINGLIDIASAAA
jgi:predicted component of type VI protein secretion system